MYLYILVFFLTVFVRNSVQDAETLKWPEKYSLRGTKINLKADLVQDFQYWRDEHVSRLDFNDGVTKTFYYDSTAKEFYGAEYEIYPKTNEDEISEVVCTWAEGTSEEEITLKDVLPDVKYLEFVGEEKMMDKKAKKFFSQDVDNSEETDIRQTVWAWYDNETSAWKPLRYDELTFSTWYGNLKDHYVWLYYNTEVDFNEYLLNTTKYVDECIENSAGETIEQKSNVKDSAVYLNPDNDLHVQHAFDSYKKRHQRNYAANSIEHNIRKEIFRNNLRLVVSINRQNLGYKLALNKLADHTPAEMEKRQGLKRSKREPGTIPFPYTLTQIKDQVDNLPKEFDLRLMGVISPIKEQVDCGCCWTMGTTSAVEGALARSNGGRLLALSNQALIDCSWSYGSNGCDGGSDTAAYRWMIEYGLPTVEEYGAYDDTDGICNIENMTELYTIRGFTDVTPLSIEATKVALVNHGPLSVSVHVNDAFKLYSRGIFYYPSCSQTALNHEVSLVGYGEQDGEGFWVIKNSWGPDWGIAGYMHISMRDNNCGVITEPTYVVF